MFWRDGFSRFLTLCLLVSSAVTNTNSLDPDQAQQNLSKKLNLKKSADDKKPTNKNGLDPYQAPQNVGPDLDPNLFDTLILAVFLKESFEKVDFEKISRCQKSNQ